jgi:hypothetical protein
MDERKIDELLKALEKTNSNFNKLFNSIETAKRFLITIIIILIVFSLIEYLWRLLWKDENTKSVYINKPLNYKEPLVNIKMIKKILFIVILCGILSYILFFASLFL